MTSLRHDWSFEEIKTLYEQPFNDLLFEAQGIHRQNFDQNKVQLSCLYSFKTLGCPEDCKYCGQSVHYKTPYDIKKMSTLDEVKDAAQKAKNLGVTRFCLTAGWRKPTETNFRKVLEMIGVVKNFDMECCITMGMLSQDQVDRLAAAGLDYYNHNLDTSPEYYPEVISTRTYEDRLDTLDKIRESDIKTCCGGILGLGESRDDRIKLLQQLANRVKHPESVPINMLVTIAGTPLENQEALDHFEFIRTIAVARIMMPKSMVRLSGGRAEMSDEMHALCFFAGANSIHIGEKLLLTDLPDASKDMNIFKRLNITPYHAEQNNQCV